MMIYFDLFKITLVIIFAPRVWRPPIGQRASAQPLAAFSSHKYHLPSSSFHFLSPFPFPSICLPSPASLAPSDLDPHLDNAIGRNDCSAGEIYDSSLLALLLLLLTRTRPFGVMAPRKSCLYWISNGLTISGTSLFTQRLPLPHRRLSRLQFRFRLPTSLPSQSADVQGLWATAIATARALTLRIRPKDAVRVLSKPIELNASRWTGPLSSGCAAGEGRPNIGSSLVTSPAWAVIGHRRRERLGRNSGISRCWRGSGSIARLSMCAAHWCLDRQFEVLEVLLFCTGPLSISHSDQLRWPLSSCWKFQRCRRWAMQDRWISDDHDRKAEDPHCEVSYVAFCEAKCRN